MAWSNQLQGPLLGCWEGTVKGFPGCSEDNIITWKESDLEGQNLRADKGNSDEEDPIRGLLVANDGTAVVCNDFKMYFLAFDLSKSLGDITAKESDTCILS